MIHACNRALESVWSAAAHGRPMGRAPEPRLLAHAFLTRRCDADHHVFAHVGPAVDALHGRELEGQNLVDLWRRSDRATVRDALERALVEAAPVILRTRGRRLNGATMEFEISLWPLQGPTAARDRLLGAVAPCIGAVGPRPIHEHMLDELTQMPSLASREAAPRAVDIARLLLEARLDARFPDTH